MSTHRDEAEIALKGAIATLAGSEPIEGLRRFQLKGTCEYALKQLTLVQEVKRPRRPKEGVAAAT
jgi:hypothetical protein